MATAACDTGLAERMQAKLHPLRVIDHSLTACKSFSTFVSKTIVALPLQNGVSDKGARTLDVELLLVQRPDNGNTERDTVAARLFLPELLVEDARLRIQELRLDMGRYVLASGERAFGLRVLYRGDDPARPYSVETLRLFVVQGKTIRPVLDELVMQRDSGEWDLSCHGRFEEVRTQLTTQPPPARPAGAWAELLVRRSLVVRQMAIDENGQCAERAAAPRYTSVMLKARDGRYPIPPSLRAP